MFRVYAQAMSVVAHRQLARGRPLDPPKHFDHKLFALQMLHWDSCFLSVPLPEDLIFDFVIVFGIYDCCNLKYSKNIQAL